MLTIVRYCAQSSNRAPYVKQGDLSSRIFDPLTHAYPRYRPLVRLILLNGQALERISTCASGEENIIELECITKEPESRVIDGNHPNTGCKTCPELKLERLVRIHTFWYVISVYVRKVLTSMRLRIILHIPSLTSKKLSLASLSICLRAAQMILSTYLEIFSPVVRTIATTNLQNGEQAIWDQARMFTHLPASWRQVRRITTSILIVIYAFWRGEVAEDETCRAAATATLLLEFQRGLRWGTKLKNVVHAVRTVIQVSKIDTRPYLHLLLPHATYEYLETLSGPQELQNTSSNEISAHVCSHRSTGLQGASFTDVIGQVSEDYDGFDSFQDLLPSYADLSSFDFFTSAPSQF